MMDVRVRRSAVHFRRRATAFLVAVVAAVGVLGGVATAVPADGATAAPAVTGDSNGWQ